MQMISNSWAIYDAMGDQPTMTFYTLVHESDAYVEYAGIDLDNEPTVSEYNEMTGGEVLSWGLAADYGPDEDGYGSTTPIPATQEHLDEWSSTGWYVVEVNYYGHPDGADEYMNVFNPNDPGSWYNEDYWSPEPGVNDGFGYFTTNNTFGTGFGTWGYKDGSYPIPWSGGSALSGTSL